VAASKALGIILFTVAIDSHLNFIRVFWRILQNDLNKDKFGLQDTSWASSMRVFSFCCTFWNRDDRSREAKKASPLILDVGLCEAHIPSLEEEKMLMSRHILIENNKALNNEEKIVRRAPILLELPSHSEHRSMPLVQSSRLIQRMTTSMEPPTSSLFRRPKRRSAGFSMRPLSRQVPSFYWYTTRRLLVMR
jgi:hypothetical protein